MKRRHLEQLKSLSIIVFGAALFALGFDLFMRPNDINSGGLTGIGMLVAKVTGMQAIGTFVLLCNIPLFLLGWKHIGRRFFLGSLAGMIASSVLVDAFVFLPGIHVEPMMACLFGGITTGAGLGLVFKQGASTGGIDIVARLIKRKMPHVPMGKIMFAADLLVVALTGLVFQDISKAMYSAVALYVCTAVMDMVIYGRNDCGVALIISERYQELVEAIDRELGRGATLLQGEGAYTGKTRPVVLCAVKSQQVGRLQALAATVDPHAFVIMQKAHQVLGDGFGRYREDGL